MAPHKKGSQRLKGRGRGTQQEERREGWRKEAPSPPRRRGTPGSNRGVLGHCER